MLPKTPNTMALEIIEEGEEEEDEESIFTINTEAQAQKEKEKIRKIIEHQKSLYFSFSSSSSSFSSSTAASCSSFSSSRRSNSLLRLMKEGSATLRRLFDMEHTSLATHFNEYSGSQVIRPILLWGSDTESEIHDDPWKLIKQIGHVIGSGSDGESTVAIVKNRFESIYRNGKPKSGKRRLTRTRSFRRLPRFSFWRCRGFGLRFRLRMRIMICDRRF